MFKRRTLVLSAGLLAAIHGTSLCLADLPAALDRVPADAPVTVSIKNMEGVHKEVTGVIQQLGFELPGDDENNPLKVSEYLLKFDGINRTGSLCLVITPQAPDAEDQAPDLVMIVPVSNYEAFVKAAKGTPGDGVATLNFEEHNVYARHLGGGYAVLADKKNLVEGFKAANGSKAAFEKSIGKVGNRIADAADVLVLANIPALKPQIDAGLKQAKEQAEAMAMMAGDNQQMERTVKLLQEVGANFSRDGQMAIVGLGVDNNAVWLDAGAQFRDATPSAAMFSAVGNAASLVGRLPKMDFLFAAGFDASSPAIKNMIRDLAAQGDKGENPMGMMASLGRMIDKVDGQAMIMGASDIGSGLMVNTLQFTAAKDPKAVMEGMQAMYAEINNKKIDAVTYKAEYKPGAKDLAGVKADSWSLTIEPDADNPMAMQLQMMNNMLYGPEGKMGGLVGPVPGGVLTTFSNNSKLFEAAAAAASGKNTLADDELLKKTQALLPPGRAFEGYLGPKAIIDTVGSVLAMMGQAPELKVPDAIAPIGFGATTDAQGAGFRIAIPLDTMKVFTDLAKQMDQAGAEEEVEPAMPADGAAPRF